MKFLREALATTEASAQLLLDQGASGPSELAAFLQRPLHSKLPAWGPIAQEVIFGDSDILNYVVLDEKAAATTHKLSFVLHNAMYGTDDSCYAFTTAFNTACKALRVVDEPLALAANALGLPVHIARNQLHDTWGATGQSATPVSESAPCTAAEAVLVWATCTPNLAYLFMFCARGLHARW